MREEGKTSIYQHKSAVYNGSHIPGAQAAFSHNDTTGGTEPYWLNTFGYSQLHGNSEFLDVMWCNIKAWIKSSRQSYKGPKILVSNEA